MGMYDSAYIVCQCPKCGVVELRECQTKQLDCCLDVFQVGDFVRSETDVIDCLTDCSRCKHFFELSIELDNDGRLTHSHRIKNE